MTEPILSARNICKSFAGPNNSVVTAVEGVDLEAKAGDFVALRGPSGCGKSTLLFVVSGLLRPDEGVVEIAGESLYEQNIASRARIRANHIGFVFQQFHLVPYLSTFDNVLAPTLARSISDATAKANSLLDAFGLIERRDHVPAALSVGEQQRVALARALLLEPKVLLADEPTGNLDSKNAREALTLIREVCEENGASLLIVSHDQMVLDQFENSRDLAEINRTMQEVIT